MRCRCLIPLVLVCGLSTLTSNTADAQVRLGPQGVIRPPDAKQPPVDGPRQLSMAISGAPAPSPALKYSLQLRDYERELGNATSYYYRAILQAQQTDGSHWIKVDDWLSRPLGDLSATETAELLTQFNSIVHDVTQGTRRSDCNWDLQMERMTGLQTVEFLLPEMDQARKISKLLALKARWHVQRGEFDEAIATLRTGYHFGQDVARMPVLIGGLVGIAIHGIMNNVVAELIQQPGAPNLYWALAELPRPPVSLKTALQNELNWPLRVFPVLARAESESLSAEQWQAELNQLSEDLQRLTSYGGPSSNPLSGSWMMAAMIANGYPRAVQQLVRRGMSEAELRAMPAARVVAIYQARISREVADELYKWQLLPPHQAWQGDQQIDEILQKLNPVTGSGEQQEILPVVSLLLPAVSAARRGETRCWADLNLLQTVEAIRMHLAERQELPRELSDITVVPVPLNPFTNRPFAYQRSGDGATLETDWPDGLSIPKSHGWQLDLTLRKPSGDNR
ncbi:MAG: hypothetical protein U0795_23785 [Pirellulales bacterium]